MTTPERLKQVMNDNNLNMKELSIKIGIPYRSLQNYLLGIRLPSANVLTKFCTCLGVNLNWLLTGQGSMYCYELKEEKAEYKKREKIDEIREWLSGWWAQADEKKRHWLEIEMERTFPEYREWLDKQGL